jgi:hypothetical protein
MLRLERLEPRDTPSGGVWLYDADTGAVRGRALFRDPAHPAAVYTPPPLLALPDPDAPGDPGRVQAALARVPPGPARWVSAHGGRVLVYHAGGVVTDLPEFAALKGVETGAPGDGGRTYDQVPAAALGATAYVPADLPWPTLHELGHVVEYLLPAADADRWTLTVFPAIDWARFRGDGPAVYYRTSAAEAFAESFRLWVTASPGCRPRSPRTSTGWPGPDRFDPRARAPLPWCRLRPAPRSRPDAAALGRSLARACFLPSPASAWLLLAAAGGRCLMEALERRSPAPARAGDGRAGGWRPPPTWSARLAGLEELGPPWRPSWPTGRTSAPSWTRLTADVRQLQEVAAAHFGRLTEHDGYALRLGYLERKQAEADDRAETVDLFAPSRRTRR